MTKSPNRFEAWADRLFAGAALAGMSALTAAIGIVVVDIIGRRLLNLSVIGTVDLTQLSVMCAAFLAIPYAFHRDAHVKVEIATTGFGARVQRMLDMFGLVAGLVFMAIVLWVSLPQALRINSYGDVSQDLGLPLIAYWSVLLIGCGLAILALVLRLAAAGARRV